MIIKEKERKCKQCNELGRLEGILNLLEPQKKGRGADWKKQKLPVLLADVLSPESIEFQQWSFLGCSCQVEVCDCGRRIRIFSKAVDPVEILKERIRVAFYNSNIQKKMLNELPSAA